MEMSIDLVKKLLDARTDIPAMDTVRKDMESGQWFSLQHVGPYLKPGDICCISDYSDDGPCYAMFVDEGDFSDADDYVDDDDTDDDEDDEDGAEDANVIEYVFITKDDDNIDQFSYDNYCNIIIKLMPTKDDETKK